MDETPTQPTTPSAAERQRQESEEYRRGLFGFLGDLFKASFWGALLGAIAVGVMHFALQNDSIRESIGNLIGLEGQGMINGLYAMVGQEGPYDLQETFAALDNEAAVDVVQSQLAGNDLLLGDAMLGAALDNTALEGQLSDRDVTLALLAEQGFTLNDMPSRMQDENAPPMQTTLIAALRAAVNGDSPSAESLKAVLGDNAPTRIPPERLQAYTQSVLAGMRSDLQTMDTAARLGWIRNLLDRASEAAHDLTDGTIGDEARYQTEADLLAQLADDLLTHDRYREDMFEMVTMLSNEVAPEYQAFLTANAGELQTLLADLPTEARMALITSLGTLREGEALSIEQFTQLLTQVDGSKLTQATNALSAFLQHADFSSLPEGRAEAAIQAQRFLTSASDVAGKTNLNVLLELQQNPLMASISTDVLAQLSQGNFAALESVTYSQEAANTLNQAITDLDFDAHGEFVKSVASQAGFGLVAAGISTLPVDPERHGEEQTIDSVLAPFAASAVNGRIQQR